MKLRAILLVAGVASVLAAFWPAGAGAATLRGVVLAKSHGTLLVASANGTVHAIRGRASVGSRVVGAHVVGHASHARLHGVVVKRVGATTFLSSNRHLLAVESSDPTPATMGAVVATTVTVRANGELEDEDEDEVGRVDGVLQVQATVTAVGAGTVTISVNGQSVALRLPAGLTLPAALVGQTVTITVSVGRADDDDDENEIEDDDGHHRGPGGGGDG